MPFVAYLFAFPVRFPQVFIACSCSVVSLLFISVPGVTGVCVPFPWVLCVSRLSSQRSLHVFSLSLGTWLAVIPKRLGSLSAGDQRLLDVCHARTFLCAWRVCPLKCSEVCTSRPCLRSCLLLCFCFCLHYFPYFSIFVKKLNHGLEAYLSDRLLSASVDSFRQQIGILKHL